MAASAQQNWTVATFSFGTTRANSYVSTPTAGNLLVCVGVQASDTTTSMTISDNMTDGGTWTLISTIFNATNATLTGLMRGWWKIVGASANSNKTVTIAPTSGSLAMQNSIVEYKSSVGGITWTENGTPTKATAATANPSPGSLTTTGSGDYVIIGAAMTAAGATAASGYVRQIEDVDNFATDIEDKFTTAAATETASWTAGANAYTATGFAFRAAAAAGGANRIRFPVQTSGMGAGGMLGGNRMSRSIFLPRNICLHS